MTGHATHTVVFHGSFMDIGKCGLSPSAKPVTGKVTFNAVVTWKLAH